MRVAFVECRLRVRIVAVLGVWEMGEVMEPAIVGDSRMTPLQSEPGYLRISQPFVRPVFCIVVNEHVKSTPTSNKEETHKDINASSSTFDTHGMLHRDVPV
jgi:hypothetical protein